MLRRSICLLRPVISCIALSHFPFGTILFYSSHPLFNIICSCWGFHYLCHSAGTSCPPCFCPLLQNSFCNGSATFLYRVYGLPLPELPCQPDWWGPSSWSLCLWCFPRGFLPCVIAVQRIGLLPPQPSATVLVLCSSRPSWNMSIINKTTPCMERWGLVATPSPKVTLMWDNNVPNLQVWSDPVDA